ncbi:Mandelate racemase/muconate lactonizing protein [Alkaliphilus metalliredigens QYMF]|uniref:Dipeptide epimerase n=1 Tax=Alkaliphilus metalliredigens (strain QYMF) TaxID=293826 RepID=A6TKI4_ALKMQ|nr:dipeptide epimerase [Alkaliphilus metalliredigens]ABR46702.1 Mandelate racemase/muconate lactonizing protein [Alkaliphilus metalliredigens QYMF]
MKIIDIKVGRILIPLKKPFKTALRTVEHVNNIIVKIETDTGHVGYGEAPPTGVITGDTRGSIAGAIKEHIKNNILGMDIANFEEIMIRLEKSLVKNTSAKAAVDIALYDLFGQLYNAPVYKLLGGYRKEMTTDITVSVNDPEEMVKDSMDAVSRGFKTLKIKVGKNINLDLQRMDAIREAVGDDIHLRLDANQGWSSKEAIYAIKKMEDKGFNIEFVEQPVKAEDLEGMKAVTENVSTLILADESVFSPKDAIEIIRNRAADIINIKLMKTGGIRNALRICAIAEMYGVECMIGCMLESKLSVTAAVHLAAAKSVITKVDLDGPLLCKEDPIEGGAIFQDYKITVSDDPGFGFKNIDGIIWDS